jgi:NitT/TauT family transport system substrate-binding protein
MKKITALALASIIASTILFSGCSTQQKAVQLKTVNVGYNAWVGFAGLFAAQDNGIFKKNGLDVKLTSFSNPGDCETALASGSLDVAFNTLDGAMISYEQQNAISPKVFYFVDTSNGADAIVASNSIKTAADLKGKTVAISEGQVNDLLLQKALAKYGLKESDVKLVNMTGDIAGSAFISGKVDAAATWEPYITNAVNAGKGHVIYSSADCPGTILDAAMIAEKNVTSTDWVKSFVKSLDEGQKYVSDNKESAAKIAAKYLDTSASDVESMLSKVKIYSESDNKTIMSSGNTAEKTVNDLNDFFLSKNVLKQKVDSSDLLDSKFLQ